jgi:hypothetical protein
MNPRRRLACAGGLSFLVSGLIGCRDDDPILDVGESIRHDDFRYTVLAARSLDRIGARQARGQFVVVHFEVANRAGRVSHAWSNSIAYLVDAGGRQYENDVTLQQALDEQVSFGWAEGYLTRAKTSEATMLVFDVPHEARKPVDLMVRGELLLGDVLDGVRFRRTRVRLS